MTEAGPPAQDPARAAEVTEWINKAKADLEVAEQQARAHLASSDAIAFHCQQAVEKLMKAVLVANGVTPPKVHDLTELLRRMEETKLAWTWSLTDLRTLSTAAVHARYPGYHASIEDAADLLRLTRSIWASLRPMVS